MQLKFQLKFGNIMKTYRDFLCGFSSLICSLVLLMCRFNEKLLAAVVCFDLKLLRFGRGWQPKRRNNWTKEKIWKQYQSRACLHTQHKILFILFLLLTSNWQSLTETDWYIYSLKLTMVGMKFCFPTGIHMSLPYNKFRVNIYSLYPEQSFLNIYYVL